MTTTDKSRADALTDDERIVLKTLANWRGLGNRERSALMKILAAPPVEQPEFTDECADCGCLHPGEYWVHPRVWSGSGMAVDGGKLCLVCLEARLQRRLTVADFPADAAINRCVLWDLSEQPAAAPIYPQGVMDIPPYSPSGSGQSQATSALTWNAPAPADERAAFVERVMGMFEAWPNGKPGPTDEPESHYRFGYNTALEDVLTALDVGSPTRRAASANETGAEEAAEPYDEGDIERHFDDHGFYLHGFEEEDRANFFEAALALVAGRSPAMAAEAVAFGITEQAAAEWASRHDVNHVLKHFSTQRNAIEDARTLHLLAAAPQPAQAGARVGLTDAARDVLDERHRQIYAEGWTPAHDDQHDECEMALAAIVYAESAVGYHPSCPDTWPWSPKWFKPTTPRRDLVKAGALILAELERLDRAALLNGADHDQ
ncbi:hypothetical protein ISF86_11980 [Burkholderia pseudomallei]|nr:hypothetical protein [Burkholderia pseudomallei]MBF3650456.1 hypothetical protein [Burkholderia pseudomallei]